MRILVYSMGEVIGDGLIKLPFAAGLRAAFPDAHIAWAAAKGETVYSGPLKGVVEGLIDEIVTQGPTGASALDIFPWVRPFSGRRFDLVIDTQENLRRSSVVKRSVAQGRAVRDAKRRSRLAGSARRPSGRAAGGGRARRRAPARDPDRSGDQ